MEAVGTPPTDMSTGAEAIARRPPPAIVVPPSQADITVVQSLERFLEAAPRTTSALGEFMQSVGEFEKKVGRSMESLASDFATKGGVEAFVRVAPPEIVAKFLQVMVRSARIGNPDLSKMTADQKIATGIEMKELSRELTDLFQALRAAMATQRSP